VIDLQCRAVLDRPEDHGPRLANQIGRQVWKLALFCAEPNLTVFQLRDHRELHSAVVLIPQDRRTDLAREEQELVRQIKPVEILVDANVSLMNIVTVEDGLDGAVRIIESHAKGLGGTVFRNIDDIIHVADFDRSSQGCHSRRGRHTTGPPVNPIDLNDGEGSLPCRAPVSPSRLLRWYAYCFNLPRTRLRC
jgi:hypothetical protein